MQLLRFNFPIVVSCGCIFASFFQSNISDMPAQDLHQNPYINKITWMYITYSKKIELILIN